MRGPGHSTIRAGRIDTVVGALVATPLVGLGLAAFVLGSEPKRASWSTAIFCVVGVLSLGGAVVFTPRLARPHARLRVKVTHDTIVFRQRGRPHARFWRDDIEMIVIEQGLVHQACSLAVYGPARSVLDTWQTGWIAKPTPKVVRTLEHHGYPHAFRHGVPRPRPSADADWTANDRRRIRTER